ncbi:MAG: four helix bundle protein [Atribacterota bacterium]
MEYIVKSKERRGKRKITEKIKNFQDLRIWQIGIEVVKDIYILTKKFPKEELYGLTSQMRRSAISIPSNIAEGFRRYHNKEYKQFLYIALGSCAELETQIIIANELNYINETNKTELIEKIKYIYRMTVKLINKL